MLASCATEEDATPESQRPLKGESIAQDSSTRSTDAARASDATLDAARSASDSSTLTDVNVSPDCIPSCVWELMKDCLPEATPGCTTESWGWLDTRTGITQNWATGTTTTMCSGDVLWVREYRQGHYGPTITRRFYSNDVLCAQEVFFMNLWQATIQWTVGDGTLIASGSESYSVIPMGLVIPSVSCVVPVTVSMDAACPTWDLLEPNLFENDASTCATATCADPDPSPYTRQ